MKRTPNRLGRWFAAGLMMASIGTAFSQTLVNGDFTLAGVTASGIARTADLGGWTLSPIPSSEKEPYAYVMAEGVGHSPYHESVLICDGVTLGSPNGGNYFVMEGGTDEAGILSQAISGLVVDQQYKLVFYQCLIRLSNDMVADQTAYWQVSFGSGTGSVQNSATMSADKDHSSEWVKQEITFTASSKTQLLSFASIGTGGPPQLGLDGVSLVAVPEPSGALLGSLVGVLSVFRRKRHS